MKTNMGNNMRRIAIAANLGALLTILTEIAERSVEAHAFILRGEQNAAMGALLDFDVQLSDARALYAAALALHRST